MDAAARSPAYLARFRLLKFPVSHSIPNLYVGAAFDLIQGKPPLSYALHDFFTARGFCIGFIICPALRLLLKPLRVISPIIVNFLCPVFPNALLVALSTPRGHAIVKPRFLVGASANVAGPQFFWNVQHG